jgi:hypothetical protein
MLRSMHEGFGTDPPMPPKTVHDAGVAGGGPLLSRSWTTVVPRVVRLVLLADIAAWVLLALLTPSGRGVAIYLIGWVPILGLALWGADRNPRRAGPVAFVLAVAALSLVEEALAYAVGGGISGRATSLTDDWVRAVPSFLGLAGGSLAAVRLIGSSRTELFCGGALAGILLEIVLGAGAAPLAFLLFGGPVAWTYGALAGFPWSPAGTRAGPWLRSAALTVIVLCVALFLGVLAGGGLALLFHA